MKGILHNIELSIKKSDISISGTCTCARGKEEPCSHIATILLHINKSVSCTDRLAQWSQRGIIEYETQTIEEMVQTTQALKITEDQKTLIQEKCRTFFKANHIAVPAAWLLKPENQNDENEEYYDLGIALQSVEFALCTDRKSFLKSVCSISEEKVTEIAKSTVGQRKNPSYCRYKSYRITASNFGYIIAAIGRSSYPSSLFGRLLSTANLEKVKAIQWGIQNEDRALEVLKNFEEYKNNFNGAEIWKSGLYLHPCGLLGASPDGESIDFVVEIKCPFTYRFDVLLEVLKPTIPSKQYVIYFENGQLHINKNHIYYHQIQGQIYLAKKSFGLLFVWTTKSHVLVKIEKDPHWEDNLNKLEAFYYEQFIPHILSEL